MYLATAWIRLKGGNGATNDWRRARWKRGAGSRRSGTVELGPLERRSGRRAYTSGGNKAASPTLRPSVVLPEIGYRTLDFISLSARFFAGLATLSDGFEQRDVVGLDS
jgi:hypothetical protein